MQASYLAGQPVYVSVNFSQEGIDPIGIVALEYEVSKATGEVLLARTQLPEVAETVSVGIESTLNELDESESRNGRGLRVVRFYVQTEGGVTVITKHYALEAASILQRGVNSFQTYEEALLLSYGLEGLGLWLTSSQSARINSLAQAYRELTRLRFRYETNHRARRFGERICIDDLTQLTQDEWDALPREFVEALCRAQLYQADESFVRQEVEERQANAVSAVTVGQATTSFKNAKTGIAGVSILSGRARREIARWVDTTIHTVRT